MGLDPDVTSDLVREGLERLGPVVDRRSLDEVVPLDGHGAFVFFDVRHKMSPQLLRVGADVVG